MSSARADILSRIRKALANPAPRPGHPPPSSPQRSATAAARLALPPVGPSPDDWLSLFSKNSEELRTETRVLDDLDAASRFFANLVRSENWQHLASHRGALTDTLLASCPVPVTLTESSAGASLEPCDAALSECDALVAQTGSLVLTSRSAGGRALSVLPPHHIVIAKRQQLVPDLPAAFDLLQSRYGHSWPSMTSFITGPSRTGDIERILVLGAHGPKRLTILIC